jgi:hypothetical protein
LSRDEGILFDVVALQQIDGVEVSSSFDSSLSCNWTDCRSECCTRETLYLMRCGLKQATAAAVSWDFRRRILGMCKQSFLAKEFMLLVP